MGPQYVLVVNTKGGCGKSTLSSNLASWFAANRQKVALVDLDQQLSSQRWIQRRPAARPSILGVTGWDQSFRQANVDWIIIDPPAQLQRKDLVTLVSRADMVIVPVLPSPIDIQAAADFIRDLLIYAKVRTTNKPVGVVANRVRVNTRIYSELQKFLSALKIPFVTTIRDTQNYIQASTRGVGIFEMLPSLTMRDREQWEPLLQWLHESVGLPYESPKPPVFRRAPVRPKPVAVVGARVLPFAQKQV